jgi:hypothetical protein
VFLLSELRKQILTYYSADVPDVPDVPDVLHVLDYLEKSVIRNSLLVTIDDEDEESVTQIPSFEYSLGILVMPSLPNSITLRKLSQDVKAEEVKAEEVKAAEPTPIKFTDGVSVDNSIINHLMLCLLVKVVWMFLFIQVIHLDMHLNNCLVYLTPKNELSCIIIDFGLATNLNDGEPDRYFTVEEKSHISGMSEEARTRIISAGSPEEKISALTYVLSIIEAVDREHLRRLYHYLTEKEREKRSSLQMIELINWYINTASDESKIQVLDFIQQMITSASSPNEAFLSDVAESEQTRQIAHFAGPIENFIIKKSG